MTSRVASLGLLIVLLGACAVWLVCGSSDDARLAAPPDAATAEIELASEPGSLAMDVESPPARDVDAARDDPAAPQREEVIAFPTETGGPTLRVVESASKRAVPFAEVFVGAPGAEWRARQPRGDGPHWATVLERGTPRRADAEGRVTLPPVRRQLMVAGRVAGLFGAGVVRENDKEPVLELAPDQVLRVRVVDAAGQPAAGVNVGLCVDVRERLQRVSRARTAADGSAELRHVQLFATRVPPQDPKAAEKERRERAQVEQVRGLLAQAMVNARDPAAGARGDATAEVMVRQARAALEAQRAALDEKRAVLEALAVQEGMTVERGRVGRQLRNELDGQGKRDPASATWPFADFVVLAEVPQAQPAQVRVPALLIPSQAVELRLQATSSLVVKLLGPDGAALRSPCHVVVGRSKDAPAPDARRQNVDALCALEADKPLGDDSVALAPVGLGLRFDVMVRFADDDFDFVQAGVPGPLTAQAHEVVVRTPGWFTALAGRFVDGDGAPVPGLDPELFVAGARGRVEGEQLKLEPDGRFELPVRLREQAPPYTLEVQARKGERRFGKLLPLPELLTGRRTELGDVVLAELPVLAAGVVQDDLARPLPGAQVIAHALRGEAWTEESFVRDTADQEGRFTLYGEQRPLRLRLRASAPGHAPAEREFAFGERLELTLQRLGAIRAEGVVPAFLPREALRATLTDASGGKPRDLEVRARGPEGFEVRADDLRPGAYDLALRVRGLPRPLAVADRVVVPPGATARPATIDGLDLRGRVFQFVVRSKDQAGQPLSDPGSPLLVQLHDGAGAAQWVAFPWRGARIEIVTDQPSVTVVGLAAGNRPARALLQPGESTLTFVRVHPLRVQLPGLRALLGPEQSARISLVFLGDTGLPDADLQAVDQRSGQTRGYARASLGKSAGASLGADEIVVSLMLNGPYEVVLRVDGPGGRVSKRIGSLMAVLDGPAAPTVSVQPDANAVRDALAELRSRPAGR